MSIEANIVSVENRRAPLKSRLASRLVDGIGCLFVAWCLGALLSSRYGILHISLSAVRISGSQSIELICLLSATTSVYSFLGEWIAGATLGKFLCGLRVVKVVDGTRCGFVGSLVRNVLSGIDLLAAIPLILTSRSGQRLGDRIGGVAVVSAGVDVCRTQAQASGPRQTEKLCLATWEDRTRAAILDISLLMLLAAAYLLATESVSLDAPWRLHGTLFAYFVLLSLLLSYFAGMEATFGATLGKLVCNLRVVSTSGETCDLSHSAVRVLAWPVHLLSAGLLVFPLWSMTAQRQHAGDMLAGTCVIRTTVKHRATRWISLAALLAISALGAISIRSIWNRG